MPSMTFISLPRPPNEWKLRGKAPLSVWSALDGKKFVYSEYFARKVRPNLIQISPEATQEPEDEGQPYVLGL